MPDDNGRSKYHRLIYSCDPANPGYCVVDVYEVLKAFSVTCPALQHAIKKLLCAGIRGKGPVLQDLKEAVVALERAIQIQTREGERV